MAKEETYYIPATEESHSIGGMGHMLQCTKCGRKILVSMGLIGTVHHIGTSATCGECLVIDEEFRKQHPAVVAQIDKWLNDAKS